MNNHLFEQMERLNDDELTDEQLEREMERAKSMTHVAQSIIGNASLILKANELRKEYGESVDVPRLLE